MLMWCFLCANVFLLSWKFVFCCLSCVFFGMILLMLLRSVFDFTFLYALTSRCIDDLRKIMMNSNLKSRQFFFFFSSCFGWHWPFHFFEKFCNTEEDENIQYCAQIRIVFFWRDLRIKKPSYDRARRWDGCPSKFLNFWYFF